MHLSCEKNPTINESRCYVMQSVKRLHCKLDFFQFEICLILCNSLLVFMCELVYVCSLSLSERVCALICNEKIFNISIYLKICNFKIKRCLKYSLNGLEIRALNIKSHIIWLYLGYLLNPMQLYHYLRPYMM